MKLIRATIRVEMWPKEHEEPENSNPEVTAQPNKEIKTATQCILIFGA